MKITIQAEPHEEEKANYVLELLEKARQRSTKEPIDLLIPALAAAHDTGRAHRDRIEREMWKRIQEVIAD